MKLFQWIKEHWLFLLTLFLLAFIPLYPKLPLVDIKNTWVYVRVEDFLVVGVLFLWVIMLIKRKVTLRTPLTIPILSFWVIGAIATIHGVILIFPTIAGVFPNVALLSDLRRIEYLSVFFIAYSAMRDKSLLKYVVFTLITTLLAIIFYGFGQRYLAFPAFLTMNEEFAKGEAIRLSALSRIPSTFAGHYDLAAYLVLVLPILASLVFGIRNLAVKGVLMVTMFLGFGLLFMTVSRVSVVVLLISLALVLFFQKKKIALVFIVVFAIIAPFVVIKFAPALLARFGNTVKEINVLVDASTGEVIGHTSVVTPEHFQEKTILRREFQTAPTVKALAQIKEGELEKPLPTTFYLKKYLPNQAILIMPPNAPTGEDLPQGTAYINLSLSPVVKRLDWFFYENPSAPQASGSALTYAFHGNFLIKRASAYDLSFTTRFQGEWPHAIVAFTRNILVGSGYGSVSLAVDNNYLRLLAEVGLLGTLAFLTIFLTSFVYIRRALPHVDSPMVRSFALGFVAGAVGLMLNAFLIDVFEASKVAFALWLLCGVTLGSLHLYSQKELKLREELLAAATSPYAIISYLFIIVVIVFAPLIPNYFVADDYTWLRWAADCGLQRGVDCNAPFSTVLHYFVSSDGFFYRPGTKVYFLLMYPLFWLNQNVYHIVSLFLHFAVASLFFLLARKILKDKLLAALTAILFLLMSGYVEIVFWVSATGHLFNAFFILLSLYLFVLWDVRRTIWYLVVSLLSFCMSLFFYELGIVVPLLMMLYKMTQGETSLRKFFKNPTYLLMFVPVGLYLLIRFISNSHWSGGDYSYNLLKFPFNVLGNTIGYIMLTFIGSLSLSLYEALRNAARGQLLTSFIAILIVLPALYFPPWKNQNILNTNLFEFSDIFLMKRFSNKREQSYLDIFLCEL